MEQWERHMPKEGLACQPQQHGGILAHRPEHGEIVEMFVGFSQDVDTLIFQLTKVFHDPCSFRFLFYAATDCLTRSSSLRAAAPPSIAARAAAKQAASDAPFPAAYSNIAAFITTQSF